MSEIFALLSVAGFATQRTLELLDPFFIFVSKLKLFTSLLAMRRRPKHGAWVWPVF